MSEMSFWQSEWANTTTAICAIFGVIFTGAMAWGLMYQVPQMFGLQADLVWYEDPQNKLEKDEDELLPTQNTITVKNNSPVSAAKDIYVVVDLVDESKPTVKSTHAIEDVNTENTFKTFLIKQIPARGEVIFTIAQNVEFFPGEDDIEHPPAMIYQYAPKVVSISSADGNAERLNELCKNEVERYDSDRLGKCYRAYKNFYQIWLNFSVGMVHENGEMTVEEVGTKHAEEYAAKEGKRVRIGAKVKKRKVFSCKMDCNTEKLHELKDIKPVPAPKGPSIAFDESALTEWSRQAMQAVRQYLDENPDVAKRYHTKYPDFQRYLDNPDLPPPEEPFPSPWEFEDE